jgi:hypothetical protein
MEAASLIFQFLNFGTSGSWDIGLWEERGCTGDKFLITETTAWILGCKNIETSQYFLTFCTWF